MTITLPKTPDGMQFEDFVAASLRTLGYFIETRIILREDKKEVLELDVVGTPIGGTVEDRILFEAKKNPPSFPDLFKLYGQREYLGIKSACLATFEDLDPDRRDIYLGIGKELGVTPHCHKIDFDHLSNLAPPRNGLDKDHIKAVAVTAWYLQIAKRVAQSELMTLCKSKRGTPLYDNLREYSFKVGDSFLPRRHLIEQKDSIPHISLSLS